MADNKVIRIDDGDVIDQILQPRKDFYAGVVGRTLMKHYPTMNWLVDIKMDKTGGLAYIRIPEISTKYGMTVMLTDAIPALEYDTMKAGGEVLERFKIRRTAGAAQDLSNIRRGADGEALNAKKGEI